VVEVAGLLGFDSGTELLFAAAGFAARFAALAALAVGLAAWADGHGKSNAKESEATAPSHRVARVQAGSARRNSVQKLERALPGFFP
jgi:hypothetical protein